jgi:2-succinyl-5-enolpyruvyl-6-hydroxy-3-cyclohexene-1-carboxylate synthase
VNPSTLLARLTVDALTAAGVGHVVLCPGSRSAPLAYQLARASNPALHVRHDERVAAFTALGVGLADLGAGLAAPTIGAVVTTSGTAAANLHPAVLEAHHANRRLVVITADRPRELRGSWANQTSELQAGLFGGAVRARLDLADTDAAKDPDAAWSALLDALAALRGRARGDRPGPVHLNLGFTDPLLPDDEVRATATADRLPDLRFDRLPDLRFDRLPDLPLAPLVDPPLELPAGPRTVVVAGDGATAAAQVLAEQAGWPLLAEPSSGARRGPNAIGPYRLLLELPQFGGSIERAVVYGRPTLSRQVSRLLSRVGVEVVLVSPFRDWPDPGRPVTRAVAATGAGTGAAAPIGDAPIGAAPIGEAPPALDGGWLRAWRAAAAAAIEALDAVLDGHASGGLISGPLLARELAASLRAGEVLLAAASNAIRDLDLAARPFANGPRTVLANRGLSGIDGTVSTATGIALAAGAGGPHTRVLVGDVAFLHDAGALLDDPGSGRPNLQIVVLNDDGGGIFSLLEYGERAAAGDGEAIEFERVFGTPHGADLGALCRGFGVPHRRVTTAGELQAALAAPPDGTSVLEVRASRGGLRDLHATIRDAVHGSAGELP